jgi:hydroxymethylbilane synthase
MTLRIATRGSAQAMTQSQAVADSLRALGVDAELVAVSTLGDRTQRNNTPLHAIGGQGVFVKEIQQAVLDGHADLAVHSAKDLPSAPSPGLTIAAFTQRRAAADALVGRRLDELAHGATVATGSVRRRAQLRRARPDLVFAELRGNINSRLEKIPREGSIVMALAALEVLDITEHVAEVLDPTTFVPAVGQGCVAVECADTATATIELLTGLDHAPTRQALTIERAYLAELGSGCSLPVGAHSDGAALRVFLAADDASRVFSETLELSGDLVADVASARRLAAEANAAVRRR